MNEQDIAKTIMFVREVCKAKDGDTKMIFGKPFKMSGGKWVPSSGGGKKEEPKKRESKSDGSFASGKPSSENMEKNVKGWQALAEKFPKGSKGRDFYDKKVEEAKAGLDKAKKRESKE